MNELNTSDAVDIIIVVTVCVGVVKEGLGRAVAEFEVGLT